MLSVDMNFFFECFTSLLGLVGWLVGDFDIVSDFFAFDSEFVLYLVHEILMDVTSRIAHLALQIRLAGGSCAMLMAGEMMERWKSWEAPDLEGFFRGRMFPAIHRRFGPVSRSDPFWWFQCQTQFLKTGSLVWGIDKSTISRSFVLSARLVPGHGDSCEGCRLRTPESRAP